MLDIYYSDHRNIHLPAGHRFPISKYTLLREAVRQSSLAATKNFIASQPASDDQILQVHTADYLGRLIEGQMTDREMRRIGFPWSADLMARARLSVGGTIGACRSALSHKVAVNLAGGTHHAHPGHGEGFCVLNDVAIAARVIQAENHGSKIMVIDLDAHQGNGTAAIFSEDASVFTLSIHGEKNFPVRKAPGDLDVGLPDGCQDAPYLQAVDISLNQALSRFSPDLVIYIAGADPFMGDRLGRLSLSKGGLAQRDRKVLNTCLQNGIPTAIVLGGGYAVPIQDTVSVHMQTIDIAAQIRSAIPLS